MSDKKLQHAKVALEEAFRSGEPAVHRQDDSNLMVAAAASLNQRLIGGLVVFDIAVGDTPLQERLRQVARAGWLLHECLLKHNAVNEALATLNSHTNRDERDRAEEMHAWQSNRTGEVSRAFARLEPDPLLAIRRSDRAGTRKLLNEETSPQAILDALTAGMDDVGRRFKANEIFVPEVLVAVRAMKTAMELLEPVLVASGLKPEFTVVIGTVEGDLHDIGKNLVAMVLKGAKFNVIDLGTNVPAQEFVEAVRKHGAQLVGLSALLTTTMPAMRQTVSLLKEQGITAKIMIGGPPVTQEFA